MESTHLALLHDACVQNVDLALSYIDRDGGFTRRVVTPREVQGNKLLAYCHKREALRAFRLDRIQSVHAVIAPESARAVDAVEDVASVLAEAEISVHADTGHCMIALPATDADERVVLSAPTLDGALVLAGRVWGAMHPGV